MAAAAPAHHGDGADLWSGYTLAVARERARQVRPGAVVTGPLQNHVHEPGAPQAAAAGGIGAEGTARLHLRPAALPALCAGHVSEMTMSVMSVMAAMTRMSVVPPCAVMRPC